MITQAFYLLGLLIALLVSLLIILIPGFITIQVLASRFTVLERVLLTIPTSISITVLFATFAGMVAVRFNVYSYSVFAGLFFIIYLLYLHKQNQISINLDYLKNITLEQRDFLYLLPVIFSVSFMLIIFIAGFHGFIVPPDNEDTTMHVSYISQIFEKQTVSMFRTGNFYPYAFHSVVALIMYLVPLPVYKISFYTIIALTAILPAALYFLINTVYEDKQLAAFTAVASISIYMFPYLPYRWGSWGVITGFIFIPFVVAVGYKALYENDKRLTVLAGLLFAGLFFAHVTEMLTAGIILAILVLLKVPKQNLRPLMKNILIMAVAAAVLFSSTVKALLPIMGKLYEKSTVLDRTHSIPFASDRFISMLFEMNNNYFALLMFAAGIVYCLYKRKYLEFLIIQIIFFLIYLDASSTQFLKPVYIPIFPWSSFDRLLYIQYFFISVFSGAGLALLWSVITTDSSTRTAIRSIILMTLILSIGYGGPITITKNNLQTVADSYAPVTCDDLITISWIKENVPLDAVILNDLRNDGGVWIYPLTGRQVLMPHLAFQYDDFPDRLYLLEHIHEVPENEKAADLLNRYNIRYVYYGSRLVSNRQHILDPVLLEDNPHFNPMFSSNRTCIFEYNPAFDKTTTN